MPSRGRGRCAPEIGCRSHSVNERGEWKLTRYRIHSAALNACGHSHNQNAWTELAARTHSTRFPASQ